MQHDNIVLEYLEAANYIVENILENMIWVIN